MAQSSGPISQGTIAERQMTDVLWRDRFGDESGVLGDLNGTAYAIVLPSDSDVAQIGSATQVSTATVAGFAHRIPADSPEPITIPAASGSARTDIVALRYDPAFTGLPGPVRLVRIAGTSAGLPVYDDAQPGVEDLPLWAVTRQPGQALSQATVQRLYSRIAPVITVPVGAPLPVSSPIGTLAKQSSSSYRRDLDSSGVPVWARDGQQVDPGSRQYGTGASNARDSLWKDTQPCVTVRIPYAGAYYEVTATRSFYVDGPTWQSHIFELEFTGASPIWTDASAGHSNPGVAARNDRETITYLVRATGAVGTNLTAKASVYVSTGTSREVTLGIRTLARHVTI